MVKRYIWRLGSRERASKGRPVSEEAFTTKMKYKVHKLKVDMLYDQNQAYLPEEYKTLEQFLNGLEGKVVAIIPNVDNVFFGMGCGVNYLFVVEELEK